MLHFWLYMTAMYGFIIIILVLAVWKAVDLVRALIARINRLIEEDFKEGSY